MVRKDSAALAVQPEPVNDDPFSDRLHGPRTRFKAAQEAKELPLQDDRSFSSVRTDTSSTSGQLEATPASQLAPACFPTLDSGLSLAENNRVRWEQEIQKAAEEEVNPFISNEGNYFGDNPKIKKGGALDFGNCSNPLVLQRPSPEVEQSEKVSAGDHDRTIVGKKAEKSVRYKSIVTQNRKSGKIVRWHKRVSSSPVSVSRKSGSSSDSSSENDQEPDTPLDTQPGTNHPLLFEYLKRLQDISMTENVAPTVASDDATRGMPYYEKLKKTLKTTIKQKQDLEDTLGKIEQSIWNKEGSYLDETMAGNIMKGFDNYIKASGTQGSSTSGGGTSSRKKATVIEQDRLFSRSSVGFWNSMREGSPHASSTSTPSHAPTPKGLSDHPTPTSTTSTKAPSLKKKKAEEDPDNKPPNKRLKITFSRNDKD